jgi:large subunit ribosomal protein L21
MPANSYFHKASGEQVQRRRSMYAVIVTGGKQYKVAEGEFLKVEKLEVATGESLTFDRVLLVANGDDVKIGAPVVDGAKVTAEVVSQGRHDKIRIIKFRRRKHHMKRQGHRQWFTEIKITGIQA